MHRDARYEVPRVPCVCGCGWFVQLVAVEAHAPEGAPVTLLPLVPDEGQRVPVAECGQCRTRHDGQWRVVG